jgi:probable F420-dependent oxidoreductase
MAVPVKVGLNLSAMHPSAMVEAARIADACGYESVWIGEHVAMPDREDWWRSYPAAEIGENFTEDMLPFAHHAPWLDTFALMGALATATRQVRLGAGIYMLALRHPVLVAKTVATLDFLSRGRIDLAVGLGWSPDEYQITGNRWETRGRRTNEALAALRVLFESPRPEFHGEFFDFPPISFEPRPRQHPFPIHIGGSGEAAIRRAVAYGGGWYGTAELIPALKARLQEQGRGGEPFQFSTITLGGPIPVSELEALAALGVHRVVVTPWAGVKSGTVSPDDLGQIRLYADQIGL